tara:strand:- start:6592 stop:7398 length:807 start_codon:yes stop_codon:yes gene_type:complete
MKLTKQHQISFIKQLGIEDNIQTRMDCPFCLNTNTFAINTEDGNMNWKCFHANCSIGGSTKRNLSPQDVEKFLELSSKSKGSDKPVENSWTVPKHFTNIQSSPKCFQYVKDNNCYKAYLEGLVTIHFDPRKDRTVFVVKDRDKPVSAVGRSLNPMVMPKWFNYNKNNVPFTCGHSDTAVIVEDCASACAVSFLYTGVALLGTTLKEEYAYYISQRFKKVIVALDRDATNKAFDLSKGLRYLIDTEVKVLEEDLKYLDSTKIKELFNVT